MESDSQDFDDELELILRDTTLEPQSPASPELDAIRVLAEVRAALELEGYQSLKEDNERSRAFLALVETEVERRADVYDLDDESRKLYIESTITQYVTSRIRREEMAILGITSALAKQQERKSKGISVLPRHTNRIKRNLYAGLLIGEAIEGTSPILLTVNKILDGDIIESDDPTLLIDFELITDRTPSSLMPNNQVNDFARDVVEALYSGDNHDEIEKQHLTEVLRQIGEVIVQSKRAPIDHIAVFNRVRSILRANNIDSSLSHVIINLVKNAI